MDEFWLSDEQWTRLQPLLPNKPRGVPRVDDCGFRRKPAGATDLMSAAIPN